MTMRNTVPFILFMLVVLFLWLGLGKDPNLLPSTFLNKPLPNFSAPQLENNLPAFDSEVFKNHISLLNVWASWCDSCRLEHPIILDIARQSNIQVVGLNYKDQRESGINFLKKMGNPYSAVLYDPDGMLGQQIGVYGTPETFIIDKKGVVRYKFVGPITLDVWQKIISPQIQKIMTGD